MNNVIETVISQYGNSPTILALVQDMNEWIDPSVDIDNFYSMVWDISQAQGFGLDIWGRIVNISRELTIPGIVDYFGFQTDASDSQPFDQAPFWNGITSSTQTYTLTDDAYRTLILTKALANISATTAPALNQLLQNFFSGRGRCYVNDWGHMWMRYTFEFPLTPYEYAAIMQSGAFPRPGGVKMYVFNSDVPVFGFSEAGYSAAPFSNISNINLTATIGGDTATIGGDTATIE